MISVIIPTLNAEEHLARTLAALVPGAVEGLVREVIIADGGSRDGTRAIAEATGCEFVSGAAGRGRQLAAGARMARSGWLLFLHADTVPGEGWIGAVEDFIAAQGPRPGAASFRFCLNASGASPRILEQVVALRCWLLALPYGDQGLLISRAHYDQIGGFADIEIMEDVDIIRRIGRRRLSLLPVRAVTSAERYRREGFSRRSIRNLACLSLYFLRVSPRLIARLYG